MAKKNNSVFFNSLKRELGKNTGKAVSNKVFGDSWATPYKRINSSQSKGTSEKAATKIEKQQDNYNSTTINQAPTTQYDVEILKMAQSKREKQEQATVEIQRMAFKEREKQITTDDDIKRLEKGLKYDNTKLASRHQARVQAKEIYPFIHPAIMFFIIFIMLIHIFGIIFIGMAFEQRGENFYPLLVAGITVFLVGGCCLLGRFLYVNKQRKIYVEELKEDLYERDAYRTTRNMDRLNNK